MHRLQNHLGGVFPALRAQIHPLQRVARDAAHTAVNVGESTAEHQIEDARRKRGAEIAVQTRHGTRRDRSLEARTHDELGPGPVGVHIGLDDAEIVGAVGVAHDDKPPAQIGNGVDIGATKTAPRCPEHTGTFRQRDLGSAVAGTVDDDDLDTGPGASYAFVAPVDELPDCALLIERWNKDRHLGIGGIRRGNEQMNIVGMETVGKVIAGRPIGRRLGHEALD